MWVFRLSVTESGDPKRNICRNVNPQRIRDALSLENEVVDLEENEYIDLDELEEDEYDEEDEYYQKRFLFLKAELFEHRRLRQGWGYEDKDRNLNLNLPVKPNNIWVENFIILNNMPMDKKSDAENSMKSACGRWNILRRMKKMEIGDIIFIPRIPYPDKFTVATVNEKYSYQPVEEAYDYANVIGVKNIKKYSYGEYFPPKKFNPYRTAISQIKEHHEAFDLCDFLESTYFRDIN